MMQLKLPDEFQFGFVIASVRSPTSWRSRGFSVKDLTSISQRIHNVVYLISGIWDGKLDGRIEILLERNRRLNLGKELAKPRSVALIRSVYR